MTASASTANSATLNAPLCSSGGTNQLWAIATANSPNR